MDIKHYYAGYRVDGEPEYTENRNINPDTPGLTHMGYIEMFCKLLMSKGLLGDFFYRFAEYDNKVTIDQYLWDTEPEMWLIDGISWKDRVADYFYLTHEWAKRIKEANDARLHQDVQEVLPRVPGDSECKAQVHREHIEPQPVYDYSYYKE
jgi:hypothetical protein